MASVIAAPPPSPASVTSRRVPLEPLSNAVNANYQTKRSRSQSISQQREGNHPEKPPVKKQLFEAPELSQPIPRTPVQNRADSRVMPPRRGTNRVRTVGGSPPLFNPLATSQQLQRRAGVALGGALEGESRPKNSTQAYTATTAEGVEKMRAWKAHYRKVFPTMVFYFESGTEDTVAACVKQAHNLGARIDKFFSNAVTHVITTKLIPPESHKQAIQRSNIPASQIPRTQAINSKPAQPEKSSFNGKVHAKTEFTFKAPNGAKKFSTLIKQNDSHGRMCDPSIARQCRYWCLLIADQVSSISYEDSRDNETRKNYSQILMKAREWGIKIWALEKLERILKAMSEGELPRMDQVLMHKAAPEAQDDHLSRLLRNERIHGPSDRDPDALSKHMVYFSGPFIMVRDMKATHKPIMVREYEKVTKREDGMWPQFRSTTFGKCPFIDDQTILKEREKELETRAIKERGKLRDVLRTHAIETGVIEQNPIGQMQPPAQPASRQNERSAGILARKHSKTLEDLNPQDNRLDYGRSITVVSRNQGGGAERLFNVSSIVPAKRINNEIAFTSTNPANGRNVTGQISKYVYEPAASGVQPSNITSAIRSQMVSSHVDIPGVKTAMSRDMLELKRKAAGGIVAVGGKAISLGPGGIPLATGVRNLAELAASKPHPKITAHRGSHHKVTKVVEIFEEEPRMLARGYKQQIVGRKGEPKAGYCENCGDRFWDFDEHTMSRRHRRFALNEANFVELDELLAKLRRPSQCLTSSHKIEGRRDDHNLSAATTTIPSDNAAHSRRHRLQLSDFFQRSSSPSASSRIELTPRLESLLRSVQAGNIDRGGDASNGVPDGWTDRLDRIPKAALEPGNICPICNQAFLDDPYPLVVRLPCHESHWFDLECIQVWLKVQSTCPLDRIDLLEKNSVTTPPVLSVAPAEAEVATEMDDEENGGWDDTYG